MTSTPIADYALLSDCHSAALVSRTGSIDWLCLPRFDSPSVFGRILGESAGHWSIRPAGEFDVTRRYVDDTLILETTFRTGSGVVTLTDALAVPRTADGHDLGADAPHAVLRRIDGVEGSVDMVIEFRPRPEYGLVEPLLCADEGGVITRGSPARLGLSCDLPLDITSGVAHAAFTVTPGDRVSLALTYADSSHPVPALMSPPEIEEALDDTMQAWSLWSREHQGYEGPWKQLVWLSGRVLYGLTYQPTGAIVAAPTTSLPEEVGGERNWDYRFAWVRDASFTLNALWVAACPDEGDRFFQWMIDAAATNVARGAPLQIMFGIGGEHDLTERELPHLEGWRDSAPVRVGNGAWDQAQLDVYGELLDAAHRLRYHIDFDATTRQFLVDVADAATRRWEETDQGIWEVRGGPRHFTYSKVMCWVALDRAIKLAELLSAEDRVPAWTTIRDRIRSEVLARGWSERIGAFTQAFDGDELDASVLMMPIVGFIEATDRRMVSTLDAIDAQLTDPRGLVYRYLGADDGLAGEEGTFVLCTFWLAQSLALAGRPADARAVMERILPYFNDVGLMAEEVDPQSGDLLGNFPQAFSHIGLVNAAWAIAEAESQATP